MNPSVNLSSPCSGDWVIQQCVNCFEKVFSVSDIVAADEGLQDQHILSDLLSASSIAQKFPFETVPIRSGEPLQRSECIFTKWASIERMNVAHGRWAELDISASRAFFKPQPSSTGEEGCNAQLNLFCCLLCLITW